jgi:putative ABC transport system permease protein
MHPIVDIEWWRLGLCALCVGLVVAIARRMRLGLERSLVVASARGTVQLLAVGYVLTAIFSLARWELVLVTLALMLSVAARSSVGRLSRPPRGAAWLAGGSLFAGTTFGLVFMSRVVVGTASWYDPQYVIPFGGMLLGNSMNGASLAGERFHEELKSRQGEVEARLALGFSGGESVHPFLARSLRAAMIPTINSFMVAGVVQLPGMMTGQILGGTEPVIAVKYQILIFCLLMTSTAITTLCFLLLVRSRYLTPAHQLRCQLLR